MRISPYISRLHFVDVTSLAYPVFSFGVALQSSNFYRSTDLINNRAVWKNHGAIRLIASPKVYPFRKHRVIEGM